MGWKKIKEHYRIGHFVHVTNEGICVGSDYIHNLIVIRDGIVVQRSDRNEDLERYLREMDADTALLKRLAEAPDTFQASIPVYTFKDGEVVEKQCEAFGFPNVTHDGEMMYSGYFFLDKAQAAEAAKKDAQSGIRHARENIADAEKNVARFKQMLANEESNLAKLEATYPNES